MKRLITCVVTGLVLSAFAGGALLAAEAPESDLSAQMQTIKPSRLWLPETQEELRGLLVAAAYKALEDPDCSEVLYGRLNEYRTENGQTAFTILCMRDPRYTFNMIFPADELEPATIAEERVSNSADLLRLRQLLGDIPASVRSGEAAADAEQEPVDTSPPVVF